MGGGGGGIRGGKERGVKERETWGRGEDEKEREKYIQITNSYIPCLFLTLKHQHLKVT